MLNETDGNILDLILTKTPDLVSDYELLTDHFNSDHFPVSSILRECLCKSGPVDFP